MITLRKGLLSVVLCLLLLLIAAGAAMAQKPTRVMIVVMDQMRPEYALQYKMTNVLWLQKHGINYKKAYVGDMASETVVSHNVMVSGLFPKHMGWSDEAIRDVDNVLGYGAGAIVTVGDLGTADYVKLITAAGNYPKLGDYLRTAFPGTIVANVGQKGYQVESMAAESSDYWVRMGSKKNTADLTAPFTPSSVPWSGTYRGVGGNPPDYIKNDPRYLVSVGNDLSPAKPNDYYGTKVDKPAWLYPEDGRYVPSPYTDPSAYHESGDAWVADAAMEIMENENWSGLFVTLSAMDKIGHMWGGGSVDDLKHYTWDPSSMFNWVHMPFAAQNADNQLGRIIAKLKDLGQFDETLIVLTADHGAQASTNGFYGTDVYDGGNAGGWYAGEWWPSYSTAPTPPPKPINTNPGPMALEPLMATGNVDFSYQSVAIETWLEDYSWCKKVAAAKVMATLPGVIATYVKSRDGDSYVLRSHKKRGQMTRAEWPWWRVHAQELVDTMAWEGSADVVGLLKNRVSYGVYGDHGGAQRQVQRIPMTFYMPGIWHAKRTAGFRLVDIMPTVLHTMGIEPTAPMDGKAYKLSMK
jgi:hypothetical protein